MSVLPSNQQESAELKGRQKTTTMGFRSQDYLEQEIVLMLAGLVEFKPDPLASLENSGQKRSRNS